MTTVNDIMALAQQYRYAGTAAKNIHLARDRLQAAVEAMAQELEKAKLHIKHIGNDALRTENYELRRELEAAKQEIELHRRVMHRLQDERDALQSKLDNAIQSSAHWQHHTTELQAKLDALEGATLNLIDRIYDEGATPLDWPEYTKVGKVFDEFKAAAAQKEQTE